MKIDSIIIFHRPRTTRATPPAPHIMSVLLRNAIAGMGHTYRYISTGMVCMLYMAHYVQNR